MTRRLAWCEGACRPNPHSTAAAYLILDQHAVLGHKVLQLGGLAHRRQHHYRDDGHRKKDQGRGGDVVMQPGPVEQVQNHHSQDGPHEQDANVDLCPRRIRVPKLFTDTPAENGGWGVTLHGWWSGGKRWEVHVHHSLFRGFRMADNPRTQLLT